MANPSERNLGRIRAPMPLRNAWGRELTCANEKDYASKILIVSQGKGLCIQPQSNETLFLYSGRLWFNLNGHEFELIPGASITIDRSDMVHFQAEEDSAIVEVGGRELAKLVSLDGK